MLGDSVNRAMGWKSRSTLKGKLGYRGLVDRLGADAADDERIAVRIRSRHDFRADRAAGAGPVFNDHRLAEGGAKRNRQEPRRKIIESAWRERHDKAYGL